MTTKPETLKGMVQYLTLYKHRKPETIAWYSRVVSVYCRWAKKDPPLGEFTGESISQMLLDKEREGRSPYYLKSLRGGLVAMLREVRDGAPVERVRSIRCPKLDPVALAPEEVEKLLAACNILEPRRRWQFLLMLLLGYYTGLDAADIFRLERKHIRKDGSIFFRRGKNGNAVFVRVPPDVVALIDEHCQPRGPLVRIGVGKERFRQVMRGVFDHADMPHCSFKTLRKSAGSLVEAAKPGTGHRHLGNTRAIFERHYESQRLTRTEPTMPPVVRLPVCGKAVSP